MEKSELVSLIGENLSTSGIGKRVGRSQANVRYWLDKYGLKTNFKQYGKGSKRPHDGLVIPSCGAKICEACGKEAKNGTLCGNCRVKVRRYRVKVAAIEYLGGKCSICGWVAKSTEYAAYEFHHPGEKEFAIGKSANKKWEVVRKELDACVLMCSRCHRIHHSDRFGSEFASIVAKYNGRVLGPSTQLENKPSILTCPICNVEFEATRNGRQYCSAYCSNYSRRKVLNRPSIDDLSKMIAEIGLGKVGEQYGVSHTTVRSWLEIGY